MSNATPNNENEAMNAMIEAKTVALLAALENGTKIEVKGRNGYFYDAIQVKGDLYVVGQFIVKVEVGTYHNSFGRIIDTVCRATKANVRRLSN